MKNTTKSKMARGVTYPLLTESVRASALARVEVSLVVGVRGADGIGEVGDRVTVGVADGGCKVGRTSGRMI